MARKMVNFRLPKNIVRDIKEISKFKRITMTDYVLSALKEKLDRDNNSVREFRKIMRRKIKSSLSVIPEIENKEVLDKVIDEILNDWLSAQSNLSCTDFCCAIKS